MLWPASPRVFSRMWCRNSQNPGEATAFKWASYVSLVGRGVGLIADGTLPTLVFRENAKKFTMTLVWVNGAFKLSATMMFVDSKWPSLIIFSSACSNFGIFFGNHMAGYTVDNGGWKWVMFQASTACFSSGLAAAFAGSIERQNYAGVAANANPLIKYTVRRTKTTVRKLRQQTWV